MKLRLATLSLLTTVVCSALVGGACFWGARPSLTILQGARNQALEKNTVHYTIDVAIEGPGVAALGRGFSFEAEGATDAVNRTQYLLMKSGGMEVELRTIESASFARLFGDTWVELKIGDDDPVGALGSGFDPFAMFEELGVQDARIEEEGTDEIRGRPARRYRVELEDAGFFEDAFEELLPSVAEPRVTIWIGEDGLPARLLFESAVSGSEMGLSDDAEAAGRVQIDLFGYGEPVTVERPPQDKITDSTSLGGQPAIGDPFEGADCYGERLADCLTTDPATDEMASNPDRCRGAEARVCLVPVGKVRADVVKAIVDFHRETKGIEVIVLPSIPLQLSEVRAADSQVTEAAVYAKLQLTYGVGNQSASTFIGITSIDIVPDDNEYGWMFGYRTGHGPYGNRHGVFSYFRMANVKPYSGQPLTDDLLHLRAAKYAARYTAILYLHIPVGDEIEYLNYRDMFGFGDLDSMGTTWPPEGAGKCSGDREVICIIPDGQYTDPAFFSDVRAVVDRLQREGIPVDLFPPYNLRFRPTQADWGVEFSDDLTNTYGSIPARNPKVSLVGVSDDSFAQDPTVISPRFEWYRLPLHVAVISAGDAAGTVGTAPHQERLYRLILRGILQLHYGIPLDEDPMSLMWTGATTPSDLDGTTIPAVPK